MIVMSVAGILALIAMPKFDVARFQMDSAMRELGSAISAARGRAILRQHDHVLTFGENLFFVLEDTNNNGMADPEEERRTVELPDRITFDRGGADKIFDVDGPVSFTKVVDNLPALTLRRNGAASEEGVIYLTTLRAVGTTTFAQDTRALQIERGTGRVRCFTYRTSVWAEGC